MIAIVSQGLLACGGSSLPLPGEETVSAGSRARGAPEKGPAGQEAGADVIGGTLGRGLAALRRAQGPAAATPANPELRSALQKISRAAAQLSAGGSVEDAICAVMLLESNHADRASASAKEQIKEHFERLQQRTEQRLRQVQRRIEASNKRGLLERLIKIFKAIGAALSAASSVFTGPLGAAAASLLVASLIVGAAVPGEAGRWISLGLSLAGAIFGAAASLGGEVLKGAARALAAGLECGDAAAQTATAGLTIAAGHHASVALDAEASLLALRAACQRLLAAAESEREELHSIAESQHRLAGLVIQTLSSNDQAALAAIEAQRSQR